MLKKRGSESGSGPSPPLNDRALRKLFGLLNVDMGSKNLINTCTKFRVFTHAFFHRI